MWEPMQRWWKPKYLLASLDQSLQRMGLEYVDIFYHHCVDPETPVEESMMALDAAVKQGKALYAEFQAPDGTYDAGDGDFKGIKVSFRDQPDSLFDPRSVD